MIWRAIRDGRGNVNRYAIRSGCGRYTICNSSGKGPYLLWEGQTTEEGVARLIGAFESAEEAKAYAARAEAA